MENLSIRPSRPVDIPAIAAILAHHVIHSVVPLELDPPDAAEMARRRDDVLARGLPFLVAEQSGEVVGYACAVPYRLRAGFRHTVEDVIYLRADRTGHGIGRVLLGRLVEDCAALGLRQMVAVIGDAGHRASIGLHQRLGFRQVGLLPAIGFKFGEWRDCVLMQRALGPGSTTPPAD